ncbi:MRL1, partial [Symbiodinium pilosum]
MSAGVAQTQKRIKSTLRVNAAVVVALRERVAVVTVTIIADKPAAIASAPRQLEESGGEEVENEDATVLRTFSGELKIDMLRVGLVVEGQSTTWSPSSASSEPRHRHE